eukprot:GFUD01002176.1.p1 GENE.GFUD01002176.1~~GFUD01002176.1.p1  ORF type:complete len:961 (-),score=279.08 GFUD01002176.1:193-3075(-)
MAQSLVTVLSSTSSSSITDKQDAEFSCKFCATRKFKSSALFMNHLATSHAAVEGGSYTCRYGENSICSACPGVGISRVDYTEHVTRHHINRDKLVFNTNNDFWSVLSSSVNLPAVLNNPGKGKQKDFFTRSWGVDFVDTSILPSSPHVCELPPNAFDRYLRKVRKHYVRHPKTGSINQPSSPNVTPSSSRETTPSPNPPSSRSPLETKLAPQKLNIPNIFLDQNFDLSNPTTFNTVFSFFNDSLNQNSRANPFQIETNEASQIESSGRLVQEKLQHYIDQVEVNIAGQVATKSHHFFQVMTYHDALMSQLLSLITVVRTVRQRLTDVEDGVVLALKVPQLALRKQNLEAVIQVLNTIETLHKTQPTIQLLLTRQEFAGALDLIATSKDILNNETNNVASLKHLPSQLDELMDVIEKMLLSDFQSMVGSELERDIEKSRATSNVKLTESKIDECVLGAIVSGLLRQQSFSFLEFLEQQGVLAIKEAIKDVVLSVLDLTEETTLTSLVADFALFATPEGWSDLMDLLVGSLLVALGRINVIHQIIQNELGQMVSKAKNTNFSGSQVESLPTQEQSDRLKSLACEVLINICDQVHERLGKLVTVRSRPAAIKLVTPTELASVGSLVTRLVGVTQTMCGKSSAGLHLSHQGQTILYVQQAQEDAKGRIVKQMETEKWRRTTCKITEFSELHKTISDVFEIDLVNEDSDISEVTIDGESFIFVDSVITLLTTVSGYCKLADQLPQASVEIGMKTAELLKLFNSRTCQLVLGAGAVSMAGLKTITIRNLGVTLRSLSLVARIIPNVKHYLESLCPTLTEKQAITLSRNFDSTAKDYNEHLGELERKIVLIVDAALNQQLANWERKPPVPSASFKAIGKQLTKFHEAIQDILPPSKISSLFKTIHTQFLHRVRDRLRDGGLTADNSPTHGLVVSELVFYRENLKYISVLPEEQLSDTALAVVWDREG